MKAWAKDFYSSKVWLYTRAAVYRREHGICQRCFGAGDIVHHKIYLTQSNINNADITTNHNNLELLCRSCHAIEHEGTESTAEGLRFNKEGELIDIKNL